MTTLDVRIVASVIEARTEIATRGLTPMRAPHHTVSELGLTAECALAAAGGALVLDECEEFRKSTLRSAFRLLRQMERPPRVYVIFRRPSGDMRRDEYTRIVTGAP